MRVGLLLVPMVAGTLSLVAATDGLASPARSSVFRGLPADSARVIAVQLRVGRDAMQPSISPDGRSVAFVGWNGVFIYEVASGTTYDLCWKCSGPGAVAWNPTGTRLAFQSNDLGSLGIWVVNRDGSRLLRVSGPDMDCRHPVWAPDGLSLVWTRGRRLWQADTLGAHGRYLTKLPEPYHMEFARGWMPDGAHLLYLAGSEMGEEYRLRVVGRDSSDDAPLPSPLPVVTQSEVGLAADGMMLYRGARTAIEFAELGVPGTLMRCFVQDSVWVWSMSLARDRSFAVFDDGDQESPRLWMVRFRESKGR